MPIRGFAGRDGAAAGSPIGASGPSLVACPILVGGGFPPGAEEIYRLAYERARAAGRPSAYEVARAACWN